MTVLAELQYPRTLAGLVALLPDRVRPGEVAELWCFEDRAVREAAEAALAARDIVARVRSAYKPLVHAFLEEIPLDGVARVEVATPVHPDAVDGRFMLEAYPLAAMLAPVGLAFVAGAAGLDHRLTLVADDGTTTAATVFAPNTVRVDHTGRRVLAPTGWLRIGRPGTPPRIDVAVACEVETLFLDAMAVVAAHPFGSDEPLFDRLVIEAEIPAIRRPLGFGDEVADTVEALHEDLYFSLLEHFGRRSGRGEGARDLRPGQIVPLIRAIEADDGRPARLGIRLEPFGADGFEDRDDGRPLAETEAPLTAARVAAALADLGGTPFASRSREGRPVGGTVLDGAGPAVAISGGQHANETTGIVGALRAAAALKAAGRRLAVTPLENPDGYALHHRLRRDNPAHMHHAARYTALGDDLGHRGAASGALFELAGELTARREAFARSGATLHINLHGYPSHEWTRPFTGYVPRGFALWAVPKGFFLIVRHGDGLEATARAFIERLARRLAAEVPEMVALNATQIAAYRAHVGELPFEVIAGIPCQIGGATRATLPLELITEYPDETIGGPAFRLGHVCQMRAAIAAAEILAEMAPVV
jgi:hypothetical protein